MRNMFKRRRALIASTLINLYVLLTTSGVSPLTILNAVTKNIKSLIQFGKCTQPPGVWNTAITQEGKCEQRNLPQGYTELDYIQSDGSQYIDLNTALNQDDVIEIEFEITTTQNSKNIFGYRDSASSNNIMLFFSGTTNQVFIDFNNSDYSPYRLSYDVSVNTRYKAAISKSRRAILAADGTVLAESTTVCPDTITCPNAYLFAAAGTPAYASGSTCRVYSCVINGKRNLIGAKDASNVVEMYDKISAAPFVNAGTGTFAAGPDTTPSPEHPVDIVTNNGALKVRRPSGLPLGYQMVEWLKPTDAILIAGFKTKSTQEITTVFYRESSAATYLYWSDTATSGTTNTTAYLTSAGNWRWDGKTYSISVSIGITITSVQNKDGVWLNGTKYGYYTDAEEFVSTNDLSVSSNSNTSVRIYSMTIREGETVTLDLVPVQRLSDNAYGFYDKVSGNFYGNPDATFEAGPVIDDPIEIYTDGEDEVLTVRGTNLLDPSTSNIIIGETVPADGSFVVGVNNWRTDYIPIVGGKTYAFWGIKKEGNTISAYNRINWYTADKVNIAPRPSYTINTVTIATAPSNAAYAILSCAPINSSNRITRDTFDKYNWMFAEAAQEIPFEPYVTPQTVTVPMLLGVGDYKDAAELIQGIKTGKVGIKVFDGTETFTVSSSGSMITTIPDVAIGAPNVPMNTHFALEDSPTSIAAGTQRFGASGTQIYSTNYYMKHPTITTAADFKSFLAAQYAAGTPVIVLYPLATETTNSMTAYPQLCNKRYNTASVEAEVDDISVTFTTGEQTVPSPYSQLPIKCNNGELKWNGTSVVADGTPEVLKIIGQNLVDLTAVTNDYYYDQNGVYTAAESARLSGFIPVKAGQKYTAYVVNRGSEFTFNVRVNLFSTDRVWLSQSATPVNQPSVIVITPTEDGYLRLSANYKGTAPTSSWADWSTLQIVVGEYTLATMPSYQPYSAQTPSVENLLAVGDYKDTQEIIDGLLTHKVGVKVFDGTENWVGASRQSFFSLAKSAITPSPITTASGMVCTHFVSTSSYAETVGSAFFGASYLNVNYNGQGGASASENMRGFKAWLAAQYAAGTPVIVVYPLAAETSESVTPQHLHTTNGTNVVSVEAEVDGIELTVEYYGRNG